MMVVWGGGGDPLTVGEPFCETSLISIFGCEDTAGGSVDVFV